jgi:hypothetical protein
MNIRDSSVSSCNSNFNENAGNLKHVGIGSYENVRMVDNTIDVISNYDLENFDSIEKNKSNFNIFLIIFYIN